MRESWNIGTRRQVTIPFSSGEHSSAVFWVAMNPGGALLAVGMGQGSATVQLWNVPIS